MSNFNQFWGGGGATMFSAPGVPFVGYSGKTYVWPTAIEVSIRNDGQATLDRLYVIPFVARESYTFSGLAINQTSATTGNVRLGIYNSIGNSPSTLHTDLGAVAFPGSSGARSASGSWSVTKNSLYYLAALFDTTSMQYSVFSHMSSPANTVMTPGSMYADFGLDWMPTDGNWTAIGYYVAQTYGALPGTFPATTKNLSTSAPILFPKT